MYLLHKGVSLWFLHACMAIMYFSYTYHLYYSSCVPTLKKFNGIPQFIFIHASEVLWSHSVRSSLSPVITPSHRFPLQNCSPIYIHVIHCILGIEIEFFKKIDNQVHSCVDSYAGPLFCSTGLHVCFCASNMLFLLLWLCSIVWSWVLWYLQDCSFCSVLPWFLVFFCVSKLTLG
jgi:hypothetical protein